MTKHKLVRAISADELEIFLQELAGLPDVTGQKIRDLAESKFGVEMGHDAANRFRVDVYGKYLDRCRQRAEFARRMSEVKGDRNGRMFADAASEELQQQVFEFMMQSELDLSTPEGLEKAESLAKIIASGRREDRKMIKQLEEALEQAEQQKKAMMTVAKDKGASPELIAAIRAASNFRPPAVNPVNEVKGGAAS